jgi:adenylate cyclase
VLQGRHLFIRYTPQGVQRAIEYFRRAIARDPAYAAAYVGVAKAYAELAESGALAPELARRQALEAVTQALRLDPELGEAHSTRAYLRALWDFDWAGAEAEFRRALELCPSSADAHDLFGRMCSALGRFDEAIALQRRAQELDPLAHRLDVATTLLRAGRYEEAGVEAAEAIEFEPDLDRAHATLGWAYFQQGKTAEGLAELERAVAASPGDTQWLAQLGQAYALAGRVEQARNVLGQLEERARAGYVAPYHFVFVYTGLGEHDRAMDLLERAFAERGGAIYGIKGSFLFAPLRSHPRFRALLAKMNLT